MKSWLMQSADVWRLLKQLRPYLGAGRVLLTATLVSSLVMVLFEGVGVGLLVPLMSLLLGGTNATPMRPIQWLQETLSPPLAGLLRRRLLRGDRVRDRRRRTSPPTSRRSSRPGSSGGSRPACARRSSAACRRPISICSISGRPARSPTSSWSRPTARPWPSKRRSRFVQRAEHRALLRRRRSSTFPGR